MNHPLATTITGNRLRWASIYGSLLLALVGCATMPSKESLKRADRIEVIGMSLPPELEPYFITDSLEIREIIAALMALDNNWRNYWASTPMHTFMFVFYEMDQKVAIVHVDENWIFMDGLIRTCTEAELEALTGRFPKRNYDYNLLETDCGG